MKQAAAIFACLLLLQGCYLMGPKAKGAIVYQAKLPSQTDLRCIEIALQKLPKLVAVTRQATDPNYPTMQAYIYRIKGDHYDKSLYITPMENSTSLWHTSESEDFYGEGTTQAEKLRVEQQTMLAAQTLIVESCGLKSDPFRQPHRTPL